MKQVVNEVFSPLFSTDKRYIILMGGRGTGRSTAASQYALAHLISTDYFRCAIMRYILGDIRNSIYREIIDRATDQDIQDVIQINDSTMTLKYGNNSINAVGFKKSSGDQKAKLKSLANYSTVIIEEADEISEEDFIQLDDSLRTVKNDIKIVLLLNPPSKSHWIIHRFFNLKESEQKGFYIPELKEERKFDTEYIGGTYLDNIINLSKQTVANYERYKDTNPDHYWNMVKGFVPDVVRGRIYTNWKIIDAIPHEARLIRRGLDFGYSSDPAVVVDIYKYNGGYILDEVCYATGMSNEKISNVIKEQPEQVLVKADSAEPKSIDELKRYGITIVPVTKGKDSIKQGIGFVKNQKISVTARSHNIIFEYENYAWETDREGNSLEKPMDKHNHAMDAIRYGFEGLYEEHQSTTMEIRRQMITRMNNTRNFAA